jgi:hypothetical protein
MIDFDSTRIAMIVAAAPAHGGTGSGQRVATGYFLTGDLVLTVGHVAEGPDWTFSVRSEVGGPTEADMWASATPAWIGFGGVDAMLLRTTRRFGDWTPPRLDTRIGSGSWQSSGFARAAKDETDDNRKTLPLHGSFGMSLGQGPAQIALQTNQSVATDREAYWQGISGAPIFAAAPDGKHASLIGIITQATSALSNGLIGLPAMRLLDDIYFRSIITPSFLGPNPHVLGASHGIDDFHDELRKADNMLTEMVQSARQKDPWAYCDLGIVRLLGGSPDALLVFQDLDRLRPPAFVYSSTLATLLPLAEVAANLRPELTQAIEHLRRSVRYLE